ncbi:MAG: tetratricopeptide repeat protein, partial [Bacteroidales bacterium]|nr:tetratricopeptide repeat protein [Bacteroidales bacterium]
FEKAIEIKPDTVESYMNLGNAYYSLKDYKNAIKYYEKAIEINSEHRSAYRNIGNAYYSIHNNEKYLENFKKAARLGDIEIQNWLRANGHSW